MKSAIHVVAPPPKPLLIYDGDCGFCKFWIRRWQHAIGESVEYAPLQDPRIATQFPELSRETLESSIHLIEPDGNVFRSSEAVFRSLAINPRRKQLADWYERSPWFAHTSERVYEFVARHRPFFSALTGLAWGKHVEPPTYQLTRWIFLRALGIVYLVAFASLWTQITGLVGENGILPAKQSLASVARSCDTNQIGWDRYHLVPTLCWFNTSDAFLKQQCAAGVTLAVLVFIGIAPAPCLFLLWLIYLSLTTIGGDFLGFQWDNLLLETGFLAIFFAPIQLLPRRPSREAPPSQLVLWLLRWLLFRLMFESGCVKLISGDATWRNLTALTVHYQTQPLPTWIGWYAYQLPVLFQKCSCFIMFGIELVAPFFIFAPRRLRQWAAWLLVALQVLILLTGNYAFFNWLALALCLLLFDDAAILKLIPKTLRNGADALRPASARRCWPGSLIILIGCVAFAMTTAEFLGTLRLRVPWPLPVPLAFEWLAPLRSFNAYGLFAVMTTSRPEIVVEGSDDGVTWSAYEFKYKPGNVMRRPAFVAPYQPRLDWQMWFAALSDYRDNSWFVNFCVRLLQGSPAVLALLEKNPFPDKPPKFIRARVYEYRFTDFATRRKTGAWWKRELQRDYLPAFSLQNVKE